MRNIIILKMSFTKSSKYSIPKAYQKEDLNSKFKTEMCRN